MGSGPADRSRSATPDHDGASLCVPGRHSRPRRALPARTGAVTFGRKCPSLRVPERYFGPGVTLPVHTGRATTDRDARDRYAHGGLLSPRSDGPRSWRRPIGGRRPPSGAVQVLLSAPASANGGACNSLRKPPFQGGWGCLTPPPFECTRRQSPPPESPPRTRGWGRFPARERTERGSKKEVMNLEGGGSPRGSAL